jgi:hypothetical protein
LSDDERSEQKAILTAGSLHRQLSAIPLSFGMTVEAAHCDLWL